MAPELLVPEKFGSTGRPTKPADIYAFGMVIFEVLSGCQPFDEKRRTPFEIVYRVVGGERPTKPDNAEQMGFGHGIWELAEECWRQESTTRPTVDQVLSQLTRVAAFSMVVGPTPEAPREDFRESGSSSKRFLCFCLATTLTLMRKAKQECIISQRQQFNSRLSPRPIPPPPSTTFFWTRRSTLRAQPARSARSTPCRPRPPQASHQFRVGAVNTLTATVVVFNLIQYASQLTSGF